MAVPFVLSEDERDSILATLSQEQRDFIDQQLKKQRRKAFMFELAKRKGRFITDAMNDAEIQQIVEDWTLLELHDAGPDYRETHVLRYQYVIRNNITGDILHLGETHLEQHAKIDAATAKAIVRGLELSNVETDERLTNVARGLKFEDQIRERLPDDFDLADAIAEVIAVGLPLIRHEVEQVTRAMDEYRRREFEKRRLQALNERPAFQPAPLRPSRGLFSDDDDEVSNYGSNPTLTASAISEIKRLMGTGMQSVVALSEVLAHSGYGSKERYTTGRLRLYPLICIHLEQARSEGRAELLSASTDDRTYRLKITE